MAISKASKGDDSPTNSSSFHWRRREVVIISRAPGIWGFLGAVYAHKVLIYMYIYIYIK